MSNEAIMDTETLERANTTLNNALLENERLKAEVASLQEEVSYERNRANSYRNAMIALAREVN